MAVVGLLAVISRQTPDSRNNLQFSKRLKSSQKIILKLQNYKKMKSNLLKTTAYLLFCILLNLVSQFDLNAQTDILHNCIVNENEKNLRKTAFSENIDYIRTDPYVVIKDSTFKLIVKSKRTDVEKIGVLNLSNFLKDYLNQQIKIDTIWFYDKGQNGDMIQNDNIFTTTINERYFARRGSVGEFEEHSNEEFPFTYLLKLENGTILKESINSVGFRLKIIPNKFLIDDFKTVNLNDTIQISSNVINIISASSNTDFGSLQKIPPTIVSFLINQKISPDFLILSHIGSDSKPFVAGMFSSYGGNNEIPLYYQATMFNNSSALLIHELNHYWSSPNDLFSFLGDQGHWSAYDMKDSGYGGGFSNLEKVGNKEFRFCKYVTSYSTKYNELESYLMGIGLKSEIKFPLKYVVKQTNYIRADNTACITPGAEYSIGGVYRGDSLGELTLEEFNKIDIKYKELKKINASNLRAYWIVISDRFLTKKELAFFHLTSKTQELQVIPANDNSFFKATKGRGKMTTNLSALNYLFFKKYTTEHKSIQEKGQFSISSVNENWKVETSSAWIKLVKKEGMLGENISIDYTLDENPNSKPRIGKITVKTLNISKEFVVNQEGKNINLTLSNDQFSVSEALQKGSFKINSNTNWISSTDSPWIKFISKDGLGDNKEFVFEYNIEENNTIDVRKGTITITAADVAKKITITQSGKKVNLSLSNEQFNLTDSLQKRNFKINSNTNWTSSTDSPWIKLVSKEGLGDNKDFEFEFNIDENTTIDSRKGEISINALNVLRKVAVIQRGKTILGNEPTLVQDFKVSPNPSNGIFDIEFSLPKLSSIELNVFNPVGIKVWSKNVNTIGSHIEKIDLTNYPVGQYILIIAKETQKQSFKLIKQD